MSWNVKYVVLIFTSTVITYSSGLALEKIKQSTLTSKKVLAKKCILIISILANIGILAYFKYINWGINILNEICKYINIEFNAAARDVILPVGISFYTFQALSYTIDVYRDDIYAERNFFRYALYVSFFPQLVAGPIERSRNLLKQLDSNKRFEFENFVGGLYLMLWGYFLKVVLADRISIFVDEIYNSGTYEGFFYIVATLLFAVQIYCDFAGYSIIAMGSAKMLGIVLMENFKSPYLSVNVSEFWKNWHISLTSWFRDYVYIPLGGNRRGKARKYINITIVFLLSGLWHGASISFVIWGGINGIYQVIGESLKPIRDKLVSTFGLNRNSFGHRLASVVVTFCLIDFSWIFFRANSAKQALCIIKSILTTYNPWILFDGSLYNCGLNYQNFMLLIICISMLMLVDIMKKRKVNIIEKLQIQDSWFQIVFITVAVLFIVIFGIWGNQYDATRFIYFQF